MRTETINIYSFDELSEEAKQKAIENNRPEEIFWADENRQSMEAFADLFPIKVTNWSYGNQGEGVDFYFTCEDEIENLSGQRLATYIWNNYRKDLYTYKQYWRCGEHFNCVGANSKHTTSKIFLDEFGCPFTGYCMDNEIIAPLFAFMRKPDANTTFEDLLNDCFSAWIKACNNDIEFQNSDDQIIETIKSNEYEFDENGYQI